MPAQPECFPRCAVVTGTTRKQTWAWIEGKIRNLREIQPTACLGLLAADADLDVLRRIASSYAPIEIRRLLLPCPCCPALSDLPAAAKELADDTKPDWLIIELPILAAIALLAHFDSALHWPREFVLCVDNRWTEAHRAQALDWNQTQLVTAADRIMHGDVMLQ